VLRVEEERRNTLIALQDGVCVCYFKCSAMPACNIIHKSQTPNIQHSRSTRFWG
jgi:hypothetical protein